LLQGNNLIVKKILFAYSILSFINKATFTVTVERRMIVNSDMLHGKWLQVRGAIKKQWGKLTDDDLDKVNGDMDMLAGVLQEKYGYSRAQAEQEVHRFETSNKSDFTQ
jgi:uncharacterized protein YjbJ (UPF0337 family)